MTGQGRSWLGTVVAICMLVGACDMPTGTDVDLALRIEQGHAAFVKECGICHASGDGLDVAFFNFSDTTIIRRAVAHVDTPTARSIVAYLRTLSTARAFRDLRLFQPGGIVLPGDGAFAQALFGGDFWPAHLTVEEVKAIDPLTIRAAVSLPLWSVEHQNTDWMPDDPLTEAVLSDQNDRARKALAAYRAGPSDATLTSAVQALRSAERRLENPAAPCLLEDSLRVNYSSCFEVRRWTATIAAQHMIRYGRNRLTRTAHDSWWDVGNVARKAFNARFAFPNAERVWAEWMYLGWIFEPGSFASTYTGGGVNRLGLPRHATFVALRSQVVRARGNHAPYADVESAARFSPAHWTFNAVRFGLTHLLERQQSGDRPGTPEMLAEARLKTENAYLMAQRKVSTAQAGELRLLVDQVLAGL